MVNRRRTGVRLQAAGPHVTVLQLCCVYTQSQESWWETRAEGIVSTEGASSCVWAELLRHHQRDRVHL